MTCYFKAKLKWETCIRQTGGQNPTFSVVAIRGPNTTLTSGKQNSGYLIALYSLVWNWIYCWRDKVSTEGNMCPSFKTSTEMCTRPQGILDMSDTSGFKTEESICKTSQDNFDRKTLLLFFKKAFSFALSLCLNRNTQKVVKSETLIDKRIVGIYCSQC